MYGKHFESMYEGSMVGKGAVYFAVWGYVIAKARSGYVEINPVLLAAILGCEKEEVDRVVCDMQQPDLESRNKSHDGRKLVKEGQFQYYVPSHEYYRLMRNEEDKREYNRKRQAELRARKKAAEARQLACGVAGGADSDEFEPRHAGEGV